MMNVDAKKNEPTFDIEKFLTISRQLDLTGLVLEDAKKYGLNQSEVRVLRYMQDTELYTVHYMKALMETSALADEEARAFLVNWGYEECYHGRTLAKILSICGHEPSRKSIEEFARPRKWTEVLQDAGGRLLSIISPDFIAVHMSWGAINELTACNAYTRMAELSDNPILAEVCRRIVKDERRHFAFYYQQAQRRLRASGLAQGMARVALRALWEPVGGSMQPRESRDFVGAYLFGDEAGRRCLREIDQRIAQLPGLEWFDLVSKHTNEGSARIERAGVPVDRPRTRPIVQA
ncbi:MAG: acyl-ACP desaturase [Myxococcales bacterium]|nr:acyl-ACP desaturase [Myxococcales bacterium]